MLQLRALQPRRNGGNRRRDAVQRDVQPGLQLDDDGADLFRCYRLWRHALQVFEHLGQQGHLRLSMPVVHRQQVIAHTQRLFSVKIKIAVQPPVDQGGAAVVTQSHGTATAQRQGRQQHADNGR